MIRIDFILSYWIFGWFVLYKLPLGINGNNKLIKYNPIAFLIIALFFSIVQLYNLYKLKPSNDYQKYIIMLIIFKLIPIISILNDKQDISDYIFGLVLFIIYNGWLTINKQNIMDIYNQIFLSIANNKNDTPYYYLINLIK